MQADCYEAQTLTYVQRAHIFALRLPKSTIKNNFIKWKNSFVVIAAQERLQRKITFPPNLYLINQDLVI